ncbi:hypothetical protein SeLEV6574_g04501 [Synchytrium endobioticum]|nr:hypothetical protein SeLEV6574_g04501 [Synchytrium endobioticum]
MTASRAGTRSCTSILSPESFRVLQPREYIRQYIAKGVRPDNRPALTVRNTTIDTGAVSTANASSLVRLGETSVLCGIKHQVAEPGLQSPRDGYIVTNIDLPAMCSPRIRPGAPAEQPQSLSELCSQILQRCQVIDPQDLCISEGNAVWVLFCDVMCLSNDGNVFDAAMIAIMAALRNVRLPQVVYSESDGTVKEISEPMQPLRIQRTPIPLTFGIFEKTHVLMDPSDDEEQVLSASVTMIADEHGMMCGSFQFGEISFDMLEDFSERTRLRAREVLAVMK